MRTGLCTSWACTSRTSGEGGTRAGVVAGPRARAAARRPLAHTPCHAATSCTPTRPPTRKVGGRGGAGREGGRGEGPRARAALAPPFPPAPLPAASRGTSVYLVGRRIDMLPKALTEDICSLRAGVERLAFSVVWRARADGTVSAPRFFKSVIRSVAALTYAEAQARIDDAGAADGVSVALKTLARLTAAMRARRAAAGALTLASPEVRFELDTETHDPLDVGMYQVRRGGEEKGRGGDRRAGSTARARARRRPPSLLLLPCFRSVPPTRWWRR